VLTDGRGVPLAVAVGGANAHDQSLVKETLGGIPVARPRSGGRRRQHLCLDKGYRGKPIELLVRKRGYDPHVPPSGKQPRHRRHRQAKARRWVVERAHSWTNRARRLLVRWEKKVENYLAFIHLQFAYIALNAAGILG